MIKQFDRVYDREGIIWEVRGTIEDGEAWLEVARSGVGTTTVRGHEAIKAIAGLTDGDLWDILDEEGRDAAGDLVDWAEYTYGDR